MKPFTSYTGLAAPLDRSNVDTDQIIPKQFLKRIERTGFGEFLFFDWRFLPDGSPNPDFELNHDRYAGASVLVAGRNFGSGSSREHAVWALDQYGFRVIVAPSFADIFYNNSLGNGLLLITLPPERVDELTRLVRETPGYELTTDLERCTISDGNGFDAQLRNRCLPPPPSPQWPGRHRAHAGARRSDRRLRAASSSRGPIIGGNRLSQVEGR